MTARGGDLERALGASPARARRRGRAAGVGVGARGAAPRTRQRLAAAQVREHARRDRGAARTSSARRERRLGGVRARARSAARSPRRAPRARARARRARGRRRPSSASSPTSADARERLRLELRRSAASIADRDRRGRARRRVLRSSAGARFTVTRRSGKLLADGGDRRAHARGALAHRRLRQPDDVDARQLRADPDLDLDGDAVDAEQCGRDDARHARRSGAGPGWRGAAGEGSKAGPRASGALPSTLEKPRQRGALCEEVAARRVDVSRLSPGAMREAAASTAACSRRVELVSRPLRPRRGCRATRDAARSLRVLLLRARVARWLAVSRARAAPLRRLVAGRQPIPPRAARPLLRRPRLGGARGARAAAPRARVRRRARRARYVRRRSSRHRDSSVETVETPAARSAGVGRRSR